MMSWQQFYQSEMRNLFEMLKRPSCRHKQQWKWGFEDEKRSHFPPDPFSNISCFSFNITEPQQTAFTPREWQQEGLKFMSETRAAKFNFSHSLRGFKRNVISGGRKLRWSFSNASFSITQLISQLVCFNELPLFNEWRQKMFYEIRPRTFH